jgi:hypothetical protein
MPKKYSRNRYDEAEMPIPDLGMPVVELPEVTPKADAKTGEFTQDQPEVKGRRYKSAPTMRGITDEERKERLIGDVHGKDGTGLVDALADVAGLTPPGMMVDSVGRAGEEIRKDPKNYRSYLRAVKEFGESGAADAAGVENAMARQWVTPKGIRHDVEGIGHGNWVMENLNIVPSDKNLKELIRKGYTRLSDNIIDVDSLENPKLSLSLREAYKDAKRDNMPVQVNIPVDTGWKTHNIEPDALADTMYNAPDAVKYRRKSRSTTTGK